MFSRDDGASPGRLADRERPADSRRDRCRVEAGGGWKGSDNARSKTPLRVLDVLDALDADITRDTLPYATVFDLDDDDDDAPTLERLFEPDTARTLPCRREAGAKRLCGPSR